MTVRRQPFNNLSGFLYELTGETTTTDLIGISDEIRINTDTEFAVLDFTNASLTSLALEGIHQIAIRDTSFPDTHSFEKLALVGLKGSGRLLAQSYKFFTETWMRKNNQYETRLFDKIEQAKSWLVSNT